MELAVKANNDSTVEENTNEEVEKVTDDNKNDRAPVAIPGNDLYLLVILSLCLQYFVLLLMQHLGIETKYSLIWY